MARQFDIEYDDFSGGYWFGGRDFKQPRNTWTGDDIAVTTDNGYLIAALGVETSAGPETAYSGLVDAETNAIYTSTNELVYSLGTSTYYQQWGGISRGSTSHPGTSASMYGSTEQIVEHYGKTVAVVDATSPKLIVMTLATHAVAVPTTPAVFSLLGTYKQWVVALGSSVSNRMYFSAPLDPTSWASSDYIDIGRGYIRGFTELLDSLLVHTNDGIYQVVGVLGQTTTVRKISNNTGGYGRQVGGSVIMLNDVAGVYALAGSTVRPVVTPGATTQPFDTITASRDNIAVSRFIYGPMVAMDSRHGLGWQRRSMSDIAGSKALVAAPQASSDFVYVLSNAQFHRYRINHTGTQLARQGGYNPAGYSTKTVTLADYSATRPFRVTEVLVEVVVAVATSVTTRARSVSVELEAYSVPVDYALSSVNFSTNATAVQTATFSVQTTDHNKRIMLRFLTNDAGPTYTVAPKITLNGVQLRRVILRCQDAT